MSHLERYREAVASSLEQYEELRAELPPQQADRLRIVTLPLLIAGRDQALAADWCSRSQIELGVTTLQAERSRLTAQSGLDITTAKLSSIEDKWKEGARQGNAARKENTFTR